MAHRAVRQRREQRRRDGNARARPVLGDRPLGEVDVNILRLIEVRRNAQLRRALAQAGHSGLAALLHDLAEVAGQLQLAAAVHHADLDRQDLAADLRPRKTVDHADQIGLCRLVARITRRAEIAFHILCRNGNTLYIRCGKSHCRLAAKSAELTLQTAHTALARVARDDRPQRPLVHAQRGGRNAVRFFLLGQQIVHSDM